MSSEQASASPIVVFDTGKGRFTLRVAGIAILDGHVLLHKAVDAEYWILPGGRAELMEQARETLEREMVEETGMQAEVGRLVWVVENFFADRVTRFHEMGLYFEMSIGPGPLDPERMSFSGKEGAEELEFRWHPLRDLPNLPAQPRVLIDRLANVPPATEHIVHRDEE